MDTVNWAEQHWDKIRQWNLTYIGKLLQKYSVVFQQVTQQVIAGRIEELL